MKVLHFVRKNSQLRASFIYNQINNHIDFEPYVVFRKNVDKENNGDFADFDLNNHSFLDLSRQETLEEIILYKTFKTLSTRQTNLIFQFIKENQINIFHFHYGTDAGIYLPLLRNINKPKVISFYGYDSSGFPKRFFGYGKYYLQKLVFRYADKVFAMSPHMKKDLVCIGCPENKIIVHYYGSDTSKFYEKHNYKKTDKVKFIIISGL